MSANSILNNINVQKAIERNKGSSANRLTNKYYDRVKIESLLADFEQVGVQGIQGEDGPIGTQGIQGGIQGIKAPELDAFGGFVAVTPTNPGGGQIPRLDDNGTQTDGFQSITTLAPISLKSFLPGPAEGNRYFFPDKNSPFNNVIMVETEIDGAPLGLGLGSKLTVYIPAYFRREDE